jgi:hypothetical protein
MVRPMVWTHILLSLEDIVVHSGHEVLMEVDNNILIPVGDLQGILDEQLRPQPINSLNINVFVHI